MDQLSYRVWPFIASALAVGFIAFYVHLVAEARQVQQRMGTEVLLIDELGSINRAVAELPTIHRVDRSTGSERWQQAMAAVQQRILSVADRFGDEPGMTDLPAKLGPTLTQVDSLHRQGLDASKGLEHLRTDLAVLHLLVQKASKDLDRASRTVHEQGLSVHSGLLSRKWDEAQLLMFMACLMAVVFALLVGMNRRLLVASRWRTEQLDLAKRHLERANHDLRETMLSKEEKEVMLKEIHHRVKNNLQIVKSLIRFQMDQVSEPRTLELFKECVNRVSAMALVHEQTYLSKDLANIDVSSYLQALIRDLVHAYAVGIRLRMEVEIRVKTLGVDTLVPLGLLINEVISNSFKHAFTGRSEGTIIVHIDGGEHEGLQVRIGDDGVGLSDRDRWNKPKSLGMELIHTLAQQLDVTIRLEDGPGTIYQLSPQADQARKRA